MTDTAITLFGTALIVAVPSAISAFRDRTTRRKVDDTHAAVTVMNGTSTQDGGDPEPLGDYIHRRFHVLDGRAEVVAGALGDMLEEIRGLRSDFQAAKGTSPPPSSSPEP